MLLCIRSTKPLRFSQLFPSPACGPAPSPAALHEKWMALEGKRLPGWWTRSRWVHTERFIQLFMHSLKHGICLRAVKWRVIIVLILIFIQVPSAAQVTLTTEEPQVFIFITFNKWNYFFDQELKLKFWGPVGQNRLKQAKQEAANFPVSFFGK